MALGVPLIFFLLFGFGDGSGIGIDALSRESKN
jgi:hypothetical protein